jgi:uncharacterized membrane protein YraQ (UPF0718 family)
VDKALLAHGEIEWGPETFDLGAIGVGIAIRTAEVLLDAGPYLLIGTLVAAILRGMVGGEALRQSFLPGFRGVVRAAAIGLALPLCSLGVLPVLQELRRAGVSLGVTIVFALSAAINPLSLVYGLTLLNPLMMAVAAFLYFVMLICLGVLLDRHVPTTPSSDKQETQIPNTGWRRLAAATLALTQVWFGLPAGCLLIGVVVAGVVAGTLPHGLLQSSMTRENAWAPLVMTLVGVPEYDTPLLGMMQAGALFRDGFSAGCAWILLGLGIGINLGTFFWLTCAHGRSAALRVAGMILGINLLIGYAAHSLTMTSVLPPDHTHALDNLTRPPAAAGGWAQAQTALATMGARFLSMEAFPLALVAAASLVGVPLRRLRVQVGPGTQPDVVSPSSGSVWNHQIPTRWLRFVGLVGIVLITVRLLYVFYPTPDTLFDEMVDARVELSGPYRVEERDAKLVHLQRLQELARKLPISATLRQGHLTPEQRASVDELSECLEALRESLESGRTKEVVTWLRYLKDTMDSCSRAYPKDMN